VYAKTHNQTQSFGLVLIQLPIRLHFLGYLELVLMQVKISRFIITTLDTFDGSLSIIVGINLSG
jgi:hypothetical protein